MGCGEAVAVTEPVVEHDTGADPDAESFSSKMSTSARSLQAENDPKEVLALLVDAVFDHKTVLVNDMAGEQRWPEFTRGATDLFIMLTQTSSHTNIKLFDVADHLATTGDLPSTRRRT